MTFYVARDDLDNKLNLFNTMPTRALTYWAANMQKFYLPKEMFPDLKWEDEPLAVDLIPVEF